jgi:hypothetical protein
MIKYLTLIIIAMAIISCGSNNSSAKEEARQSIQDRAANAAPINNGALATNGSVQHYTCPNNCAGSGGAAQANCPVCGTAYVHNQAFHNAPTDANGVQTTQTTQPTPATNAAGQYHYTCSNGCAGGSGTQGNCATCGSALAHNAAYHN